MSINKWFPAGTRAKHGRLAVGDLIAVERAAWRVMHVADAEPTQEERERVFRLKPERQAEMRPYMVTLRRAHGAEVEHENEFQECAMRVSAGAWNRWDHYDEDRVPLCSCCGHPWPCIVTDAMKESTRASEVMERKMANARPGCCYSCGEVISHRQGSMTYPEPNVEIPGFPAPRFHTRNACHEGRYQYEKHRARALPDAPSLLETEKADSTRLWGDS